MAYDFAEKAATRQGARLRRIGYEVKSISQGDYDKIRMFRYFVIVGVALAIAVFSDNLLVGGALVLLCTTPLWLISDRWLRRYRVTRLPPGERSE